MRLAPPPLMLFAAGLGKRMGALTANRPKPMIEVAGMPLIDHALALADKAGITRIAVNTHYLPDQIESHLAQRKVAISREEPLVLETGGGLKRALPLLGGNPVMTLNTDAVWTGQNALTQLLEGWDGVQMDALLLLLPAEKATGYSGNGDFFMNDAGRLTRANGGSGFVYLGAQIIRTDGLAAIGNDVFSLNWLWDRMIAENRLYGLIHNGGWCDVGRPEGITLAETLLGYRK